MPNWKELPYEIQSQVFIYIHHPKQLEQLQLTCKIWSRAAQECLYTQVGFGHDFLALKFFNTIATSPTQPGHYVKTVILDPRLFKPSKANWDPNGYVDKVIKYCPNVEILHFPSFKQLNAKLIKARDEGYLQHVHEFSQELVHADFLLAS